MIEKDVEEYQQLMARNLGKLEQLMDQMLVEEYQRPLSIPPSAAQFNNIIDKLDALNDKLRTINDSLKEQRYFDKLRAVLWRKVSIAYKNSEQMLNEILAVMVQSFNFDVAGYFMAGANDGIYHCVAAQASSEALNAMDFSFEMDMVPIPEFYGYQVLTFDRSSFIFSDPPPPKYAAVVKYCNDLQLESVMSVCVRTEHNSTNVGIVVGCRTPCIWPEQIQQTIAALAMVCQTRMEQLRSQYELTQTKARLEKEVTQRTRELSVLNVRLQRDLVYKEQVEEELRANMELYRTLVEAFPDPVMAIVPSGRIFQINSAVMKAFGARNEKDICGHLMEEFCPIDIQKHVGHKYIEYKVKRCDGTEFLCEVTVANMNMFEGDENSSKICIFHDITERRRQEQELTRMVNLESLGILAGGIAHDFNNILSGLAGYIFMAQEVMDSDARKSKKLLSGAYKSIIRAKNLTAQLLTFAKGGEPVKDIVDMRAIMPRAVNCVVSSDSKITCNTTIAPGIMAVKADCVQLMQVMTNLLINAAQEIKSGVIDLGVKDVMLAQEEKEQLPAGKYILITVADRGRGIPENVAPYVFHPFYTTKEKGTGLGLAIVYSVIKRHGGVVEFAPREGGGTVFSIYLPAVDHLPLMEDEVTLSDTVFVKNKKPHNRILLLEDDEDIQTVSREILSYNGYEPTVVATGEEALAAYKKAMTENEPFSVVLLDLIIVGGGMDGRETMVKLLEVDPNIYSIVVSGYSNDPIVANFQQYGFKDALVKPYTVEEINRVLQKATLA